MTTVSTANAPTSPEPTPAAAPRSSAPVTAPVRRRFVALKRSLSIAYALTAGCFCVWLVSFTPVDGGALTEFVPARAGVVLHVRDARMLVEGAARHPAMQELFDDPDFEALVNEWLSRAGTTVEHSESAINTTIPQQLTEFIQERESHLARPVRWLVKTSFPRLDSLYPLIGNELLFVRIFPELDANSASSSEARAARRRGQLLILTRVSGGRGLIARIAAHFSKSNGNATLFDLGGDVIGIGLRGAAPGAGGGKVWDEAPLLDAQESPPPFARLTVLPPIVQGKRAEGEDPQDSPLAPYLGFLAESIGKSLFRPPTIPQMFALDEAPKQIRLNLYLHGDTVVAHGAIEGGIPALPPRLPDPLTEQPAKHEPTLPPYFEGVLPLDPKACFLAFMADELRVIPPDPNAPKPAVPAPPLPPGRVRGFKRSQQHWLDVLMDIRESGLDLDDDLWPAFGRAVRFRMDESPADLSATGYGLLRIATPFDGERERARMAIGELLRGQWDVFEDHPRTDAKMPYLRLFRGSFADRFVLATGEISAPTLIASNRSFSITSDAGSFALLNGAPVKAPPAVKPADSPRSYFVRIDGPRLAPNVETFTTQTYSDLEKKIGSKEFLAKYANHDTYVAVARKATGLLGDFFLEITPTQSGSGDAAITLTWKPGTIKVESGKRDAGKPNVDGAPDAMAPPPPPDENLNNVPPPPPP